VVDIEVRGAVTIVSEWNVRACTTSPDQFASYQHQWSLRHLASARGKGSDILQSFIAKVDW
jgi:hypothetical protein